MNNEFLVSVYCLTYNHINYVKQALDGILNQKTNFKFNVFIFDDSSTDGTSEVVRYYENKYTNVHAVISNKNTYGTAEREYILRGLWKKHLTGKYVAVCELDDLWVDETKLQRQVEFMEANPNVSMTMHRALRLNSQNNVMSLEYTFGDKDRFVSAEEAIAHRYGAPAAASMVMKNDIFFFDGVYARCGIGDKPRLIKAAFNGEIYYFSRIMSVYRFCTSGSWTSSFLNDVKKRTIHNMKMIRMYNELIVFYKGKYKNALKERIDDHIVWILRCVSNLIPEKIEQLCKIIATELGEEWGTYLKKLVIRNPVLLEDLHLEDDTITKCNQHDSVYIFGAGEYGNWLARKLDANKIKVKGFVQTTKEYLRDDQITSLDNFIKCKENYIILIGVGPTKWNEVIHLLEEAGIKNWLNPFAISCDC